LTRGLKLFLEKLFEEVDWGIGGGDIRLLNMLHVVILREGSNGCTKKAERRFNYERAAGLVFGTSFCLVLAISAITSGQTFPAPHTFAPSELLMTLLCCDGCCKASSSAGSILRPYATLATDKKGANARATVLHIDDHDEIDYTANGHRVPQHMENAMNEIEKIEHRVQLSMPRYLKESAAEVRSLSSLQHSDSNTEFVGRQPSQHANLTGGVFPNKHRHHRPCITLHIPHHDEARAWFIQCPT
jgi:hypothetical protein